MSFRQFPATDANGEQHIILEFKPEPATATGRQDAEPRYELDDGRQLLREGPEFITTGGELRLTIRH